MPEQYYHCDEPGVFDKALDLYRRAMKVTPNDFCWRAITPTATTKSNRTGTNDMLGAWTNAYNVAQTGAEREGRGHSLRAHQR